MNSKKITLDPDDELIVWVKNLVFEIKHEEEGVSIATFDSDEPDEEYRFEMPITGGFIPFWYKDPKEDLVSLYEDGYDHIKQNIYGIVHKDGTKVYDFEEMICEFEQKLQKLDPSVRLIITFDTK